MRTDWLKIVFLQLSGNTELARGFDVMMAGAKIIDILMIKESNLFPYFSLQWYVKEIENMFSVFLSSLSIKSFNVLS